MRQHLAIAIHHGAGAELPGDLVLAMQSRTDGTARGERILPETAAAARHGVARQSR